MHQPRFPDKYDWHGCAAVRFDPEKLGGRATVLHTRMDADGVLLNYQDGLTIEDIVESFGVDRQAVEEIIAFAEAKGLRAIS